MDWKSETIGALAAALSKAQGEIENAAKDRKNDFFKASYATLASVIEAVKTPLAKNGLSYCQIVEGAGETLSTILMHSSGEWIKSVSPIKTSKNDAQGYGSGLTYARRYALSAICGVTQDDDDGNEATGKPKQATEANRPDFVAYIQGAGAKLKGFDAINKIVNDVGYESIDKVQPKDFHAIMSAVKALLSK